MANNLKPIQIKLKEAIRKTSFMKNRHSNALFKQHKVLNFEKQETLVHETFWNICMIYVECYKWRGRKYYYRTTSVKRENLWTMVIKSTNFTFPVRDQTYWKETLYIKGQSFGTQ